MSGEQTEKQIFRNILLKKPAWKGLAGSELEDIITTYVGQRAEATLFEIERGRQENFLQLARDRESILARAEAEGYVPILPKPLQIELKITNEGPDPIPLDPLLNLSRPLELIADDETKLILGDRLLALEGPPGTETEPPEPPEEEPETEEEEEEEPENTTTQITKTTSAPTAIDVDQTRYSLNFKTVDLGEGETVFGALPSTGDVLQDYTLKISRFHNNVENISDLGTQTILVARKESDQSLYFRVCYANGDTVALNEDLLPDRALEITALKNKLSKYWGEEAANENDTFVTVNIDDMSTKKQSAVIYDVLSITACDHSVVIAKASNDDDDLYFQIFDRDGHIRFNKAENGVFGKTEQISALKEYLEDNIAWPTVNENDKSTIIGHVIDIADYERNPKWQISTQTQTTTIRDTYPTGKLRETVTITDTTIVDEIDHQGASRVVAQDISKNVTVTETETITTDNGVSIEIQTIEATAPDTDFITKTVIENNEIVSKEFTDPITRHVTKLVYDPPNTLSKTITTFEIKTGDSKKWIQTEEVPGEGAITVTETVEDDTKRVVKISNRQSYGSLGSITEQTTFYKIETKPRSVNIKPSVEALEENLGWLIEENGIITWISDSNENKYIDDDDTTVELDGDVLVTERSGITIQTNRTTKNDQVTVTSTTTWPSGKTKTVKTIDDVETMITEKDPDIGLTTTITTNLDGTKTVKREYEALRPNCSAIINAKQLWREVKYFQSSPETGKIFQEFIIGGSDEHGEFTIHDFEVEINDEKWREERNFLNGGPDSEIYHSYYRLSDELAFRLGDGEVGKIPPPASGIKATVWHTLGDRVFMSPGRDITQLLDTDEPLTLTDTQGNNAELTFVSGQVLENGQPLESVESVRKSALSHIQVGGVAARSVDYEYRIRRRFPELLYLKVWGEKEQNEQYETLYAHTNKAFFTFLIALEEGENKDSSNYITRKNNARTEIENYFNTEIKPMNVEPKYEELNEHVYGVTITGKIDRIHPDISTVEQEIKDLLTAIFGRDRSEKNLLRKFANYDKKDKFMELFQRFFRLNGHPKKSDIYDVLWESGYFRDAQPHLNRRDRPYYEIELTDLENLPEPGDDFFTDYIYLDAGQITFSGGENDDANLGYADNF